MDSYFLSETLKYLFLIFDEALHALPSHDGDATLPLASGPQGASLALDPANVVMTTEGHVLPLLSPTLLPVLRTSSEPRAGAAPAAAAATAHSAVCPSPQAHRPPRAAGGHKAATDRETTNKASAVPATVDLAASSHAAAPPDGQAIDLSRAFQQQGMAGVVAMLHHVMDRGSEVRGRRCQQHRRARSPSDVLRSRNAVRTALHRAGTLPPILPARQPARGFARLAAQSGPGAPLREWWGGPSCAHHSA